MNWIKTHPRHTVAIVSLAISFSGVVLLLPKSPWTLIIGGLALLLSVGISCLPD